MARPHMSWFCAIFTLGFVFSSVFGKQLHVLLLTSSSERLNSSGAVSSAMMATALVNAAPYLLPGYDIITINRDTKCDGTTSVREFLMQVMLTSPTIIGVIGCGCSVATEPVADVVSLYGLPLISFTSSAAGLETKSLTTTISTPSYYQLFPSDDNLVPAIVALIKEYNWTQVSIISEKEDLFLKLEDQLCAAMTAANVTVLNPSHFTVAMEQLENSTLLDGKYSSIFISELKLVCGYGVICSPPMLLWHIPDFPDDQPAHRGSPCILKHGSIQLVQLLASKLCRSSKCTLVNYQLATTDANLGVPIYWTGPLHWTNGLIFEPILASMTAANYHNAYMELCNCASFKVAGLRKAFIRQMWHICSLIIHEHTTFT